MNELKRKTARDGIPGPMKRKEHSHTAGRQETTISRIKIPQTQCTQQDGGDARCDGTPSSHPPTQHRGADGPDSAQSLEAQQSQFIDEALGAETVPAIQEIQKIVELPQMLFMDEVVGMPGKCVRLRQLPQIQYIDKIVGVPVMMQHQVPTVPV